MKPTTPDDIFDLMDAYVTSAALNTAMQLGLFWLLTYQPMDPVAIAETLGIPPRRCHYWLQLLSGTGLIEQSQQGFALSATAQSAIIDAYSRETWSFIAGDAEMRYPLVHDLTANMRQESSVWEIQGKERPDYFAQIVDDPDRARRFTRMLYELHIPLADPQL